MAWSETDYPLATTNVVPASGTISSDLAISKSFPGVIFQGSDPGTRQDEIRVVTGVMYCVDNATYNGTNWVEVNTAVPAYGWRLDSVAGTIQWIYTAATGGNITWTVLGTVTLAAGAGDLTVVGKLIAPTIGPVSGQQHTVPAVASDTLALLAATQTLLAKTLTSPSFNTQMTLIQSTANYTLTWANPAAARAISIPDPGATDVFAFLAATQTLSNKTIAAAILTGASTLSGAATIGGSNLKVMTQQLFTSGSGTYILPTGARLLKVTMVGGGGGGAGANGATNSGGGGGGGGGLIKWIASPSATYAFVIGTAGAGGALNGNGSAGGNTTFGTSFLTANGGAGGSTADVGGAGGTATGGDLNISGANGWGGAGSASANLETQPGGSPPFGLGIGAMPTSVTGSATNGLGYGAGGAGAPPNGSGGNGSAGLLIVEEFY